MPDDESVPMPEEPRLEEEPVPLLVSSIRCCCLPEPVPFDELFMVEPVPVLEVPEPVAEREEPIVESVPEPVEEEAPD